MKKGAFRVFCPGEKPSEKPNPTHASMETYETKMMMVMMHFEAFMRTRVFSSLSFWSFYVVTSFLVQLKTKGLAFKRSRVFGSSCFKTLMRTVVHRVFWCICSFESLLKTRVFIFYFLQSFDKDQSSQRVLAPFMFFFSTLLQGPEFLVFFSNLFWDSQFSEFSGAFVISF